MDPSSQLSIQIEDTTISSAVSKTCQLSTSDKFYSSTRRASCIPAIPPLCEQTSDDPNSASSLSFHFKNDKRYRHLISPVFPPNKRVSTRCPLLHTPPAAGVASPQLTRRGSGAALRLGVQFDFSRRGSECIGAPGEHCRGVTAGPQNGGAFGLLRPLSTPGVPQRRSPSAAAAYASAAAEVALKHTGIYEKCAFKSRECLLASIIAGECNLWNIKLWWLRLTEGLHKLT